MSERSQQRCNMKGDGYKYPINNVINQPTVNTSNANTIAYSTDTDFFSNAKNQLHLIIQHFESIESEDHGCTETYLNTEGDELKRLLFQGYLYPKHFKLLLGGK